MLAHLVTGRHAAASEDHGYVFAPARPNWLRRLIAALLQRKR
jgi:hypothetical protein